MEYNKNLLFPYLIYNKPFPYNEHITLYPVTMNDIVLFQALSPSITVRKNSIFHDKAIIKMTYLDFLRHCLGNRELEQQYQIPGLSEYYPCAVGLLRLCCKDAEIRIDHETGDIFINSELVTPQIFDDIRRIIVIQNDLDFDIDEFIHHDTEKRLQKAWRDMNKTTEKADIEDYIDSLVITMNITEEQIMNMTIRKFWRYIKRYQLHETYLIAKTGECSGMVSFKEPIRHWMISLEEDDKYHHLKADEHSLRGKISQ